MEERQSGHKNLFWPDEFWEMDGPSLRSIFEFGRERGTPSGVLKQIKR